MTLETANDGCAIYFLDVPEFAALVAELRAMSAVSSAKRGDYFVAHAHANVEIAAYPAVRDSFEK
jgi:hypothetical protein